MLSPRPRRSVERMSTTEGAAAPATLAAWLRTRSDEQLGTLLALRPDVARPAPSDVVGLATRLAVPVSVDRALDELDAGTLQVLDVVLLAPVTPDPDELARRPPRRAGRRRRPRPAHRPRAAVGRRRAARPRAGPPRVRHPAGLGRPRTPPPSDVGGDLADVDDDERAVLETLAGENPLGRLPSTTPAARRTARPAGCCAAAC